MAKPQKRGRGARKREAQSKSKAEEEALQSNAAKVAELQAAPTAELLKIEKFEDLPLSAATKKGLKSSHFTTMTSVQRECIIPALSKSDLLVAARTGSGKTIGFLVPLLERLLIERWSQYDGLGALIITPTRELALQIFDVLRKIGKYHSFSAGLLIGGNNVREEMERIGRMNILVCTPGRLLQHMDQSPGFDCNNLQLLVLDEADRIMDMGFKKTVDAIVENLPPQRQTMLFSATQTKNVSDLARLSLRKPKYISVLDSEQSTETADEKPERSGLFNAPAGETNATEAASGPVPTPKNLEQFYTIIPLNEKLDLLWSFIKTHLKSKILVFFSSSKQVRFVYESFRRMQPGMPLLHLHGRQKQSLRMETTNKFMKARESCLLATDVVARGIDFPEIEWVIQVDCPEDVATYIHRVGRSARANKHGKALLLLSQYEKAFVTKLEERRIPINIINVRDSKRTSIQPELQAQLFQDPELKYLAQKAFVSYVRSVYLQKDKSVFNVENIKLDSMAKSFGLMSAPNVKIKAGANMNNKAKNLPRALKPEQDDEKDPNAVKTKYDRIFNRQNQNVLSEHYQKLNPMEAEETSSDDEKEAGGLFSVKRRDHDLEVGSGSDASDSDGDSDDLNAATSKRSQKRALSKKQSLLSSGKSSTKLVFDDEGVAHPLYEFDTEADFHKAGKPEDQRQQFVTTELQEMEERDVEDKDALKQRRLERKRHRKEMERLALQGSDSEEETVARLPSDNEDEEGSGDDSDDYSRDDARDDSDSDSDSDVPVAKKQKTSRSDGPRVLEVEEPETLEDLEALSRQLLGR